MKSFKGNLSNLVNGKSMFNYCLSLANFDCVSLDSLTNAESMFIRCKFTTFDYDISKVESATHMFMNCTNLESFKSDLPKITDGSNIFENCKIKTFNSDIHNVTNGYYMFKGCKNLTSFSSNLSNLTNGYYMFHKCILDTPSVQNIADTIKDVTSLTNDSSVINGVYKQIYIGIGNITPNEQETAAFNKMVSKGWTVYVGVNGGSASQWTPTSLTPLDGEEISTPIPFYAKPVPATEETATYTDEQGNYYNISGGNYVYGDDLSTYGMFTCEEDAAANMRLTKIEK
jgi:hypothetical protein